MGLAILILGLAVFLAPHTFTAYRDARADVIARVGTGPYKAVYSIVSLIGLVLIGYGFALYRASRLDRRLVSAALDAPRHGRAGVAGHRSASSRPTSRADIKTHAQASDAGRREALGVRASALQRRSRLDHPVRLDPGLGGVRPHLAQAPHRSGRAADPGRRRTERRHRRGRRHGALSSCSACASIPM